MLRGCELSDRTFVFSEYSGTQEKHSEAMAAFCFKPLLQSYRLALPWLERRARNITCAVALYASLRGARANGQALGAITPSQGRTRGVARSLS